MLFEISYEMIDCQNPQNRNNICRIHKVVKFTFKNENENKNKLLEKATQLANSVIPNCANNSVNVRDTKRLLLDAIAGVLSENALVSYINKIVKQDIARLTPFKTAKNQIDIQLNNGKTIEVRSSYIRNGVKFGICNEKYNFKNICKYENLYKPDECNKDFFACVLFETNKENFLNEKTIIFYFVGGSTKQMMMDDSIAFINTLEPEDDLIKIKTNYRVIKLKDALDANGFEEYLRSIGYKF
ncbi:hypothetical protein [Campylobacter sp. 2018MI13]|uniref:hypothetical protein n=1 Tax=Campylobacter sp. 2018MI13 TaxID=2836737 RepID=UPI001BD99CE7|nr:hypothetical protein [Campylobacter sp. 2018MI13]MBT0883152.1 hypothetical protein [Campylobacter sp. 2018MI13]